MLYALNDLLASFVFIDCIIVWKFMLKCVLRVRIKIYIYIGASILGAGWAITHPIINSCAEYIILLPPPKKKVSSIFV